MDIFFLDNSTELGDYEADGLASELVGDSEETAGAAEEGLDFDLQPHEVISRIETCALWLTEQVSQGQLPDFALLAPSLTQSPPSSVAPPPHVRSLLGRHADSADRFARLCSVLNACHEALVSNLSATQRELHYRLKPLDVFASLSHLQEAVQDAVLLLRVPRSSLGIHCSSKGLVSGALLMHSSSTGEVTDCAPASAPGGRSIAGNLSSISNLSFSTTATTLLVIEKDTVFQQLAADPAIGSSGRFILVTGKGVPDVATRAFIAAVHAALPHVHLLGLVDWNPSGVGILCLYRHGSRRMAESMRYALPALRWLGVRSSMLQSAAGGAFHDLTPRDHGLIRGLRMQLAGMDGEEGDTGLGSRRASANAWLSELAAMEAAGSKADIEAVYYSTDSGGGVAELSSLLQQRIALQDWI